MLITPKLILLEQLICDWPSCHTEKMSHSFSEIRPAIDSICSLFSVQCLVARVPPSRFHFIDQFLWPNKSGFTGKCLWVTPRCSSANITCTTTTRFYSMKFNAFLCLQMCTSLKIAYLRSFFASQLKHCFLFLGMVRCCQVNFICEWWKDIRI